MIRNIKSEKIDVNNKKWKVFNAKIYQNNKLIVSELIIYQEMHHLENFIDYKKERIHQL